MAKKMNKGVVALSSAAILSVYGIGYAMTQPAAGAMAAGQASAPTAAAPAPTSSLATEPVTTSAVVSPAQPAPPRPNTPPTATAAPVTNAGTSSAQRPAAATAATASGLKDGTYTGSGMSRHGGVSVKVTIQNGRIVSAPITGTSTRYSPNVIAGLPAKVVAAQSSQVNLVSGATDSSMAYVEAVAQALNQAGGSTSAAATGVGGSVQVTGPRGVIYSTGGGRGRGSYGD